MCKAICFGFNKLVLQQRFMEVFSRYHSLIVSFLREFNLLYRNIPHRHFKSNCSAFTLLFDVRTRIGMKLFNVGDHKDHFKLTIVTIFLFYFFVFVFDLFVVLLTDKKTSALK